MRSLCGGLIICLVCLACLALPAQAHEPVVVYYFERPPLYLTTPQGEAAGLLVERASQVFRAAGIPYRLQSLPPRRIKALIFGGARACGVGWFLNPERGGKARFSEAIYQDRRLVLVAKRSFAADKGPTVSLDRMLAEGLTLALIDGFSYGEWADKILARLGPEATCSVSSQAEALRMVARGRCGSTLINAEEAKWHLAKPDFKDKLAILRVEGAPPGNLRRLMCGWDVGPEEMDRINQAIRRLHSDHGHP